MEDYLPIGSIVRLTAGDKRFMIAGIIQMEEGADGDIHDYLGLPYPEGFLGRGMNFLFDNDDISEVVFRGYEDQERERFLMVVGEARRLIAMQVAQEAAEKPFEQDPAEPELR